MNKQSGSTLLYLVIALVVVFASVKLWDRYSSNKQVAETTTAEKRQAELLQKKVLQQSAEPNSAAAGTTERPPINAHEKAAAEHYWRYLATNTKIRPEYCKQHGVMLYQWVSAVERANDTETARAQMISAREKINAELVASENTASARQFIEDEMSGLIMIRKAANPQQVCELFDQNAEEMLRDRTFAKMMAPYQEILIKAQ